MSVVWFDEVFSLEICPLTGLAVDGRASFQMSYSPGKLLYVFKPIGSGLFSIGQMSLLKRIIDQPGFKPRTDLAGICRETSELGHSPVVITPEMFDGSNNGPKTFDEKQAHFLRLLYDTGGREHKPRDIDTFNDFPMAFAQNAGELYRIIESLLDDGLIQYKKSWVVSGDWKNDILSLYQGILPTPSGKRAVKSSLVVSNPPIIMPSNNFHFGDGAKVNLVQGDGAVQTNVTGNNAAANVSTGNQNTQTNQAGQPISLPELVAQLKQAFTSSEFDSCREEIEHELGHVEIQLKKQEPKKSLLERSFDYLKELAVKSAGPAAASAVIELIKHAPALLAAAHI